MTHSVDLFWSFRSPYSYLATPRILAMEREWDVNVNVCPVFPIAIRNPDFFDSIHPLWIPYLLNDVQRVAKFYGMTFAWPSPDPIIMNMKTKVISQEQPYIFRLTRLGVEAARRDAGLPFLIEVSEIIFSGKTEGWDQGDHLAQPVQRGIDVCEGEMGFLTGDQREVGGGHGLR